MKHLESSVKDPIWKPILKVAIENCMKDVVIKREEIVKDLEKAPFNIKTDQCNSIFLAMFSCIQLETFAVIFDLKLLEHSVSQRFKSARFAQKKLGLMKRHATMVKHG